MQNLYSWTFAELPDGRWHAYGVRRDGSFISRTFDNQDAAREYAGYSELARQHRDRMEAIWDRFGGVVFG